MTQNSVLYFPENIQSYPLYPKICEMVDFVVSNFNKEIEDFKYKWRGPGIIRNEVIFEIIAEYGYIYLNDIAETLSNVEFSILLYFLGMLALLKGHRSGLENVLRLLGMDSQIIEWWEGAGTGEPCSFSMIVFMDTSTVKDVFATLEKVRNFTEHYVYPKFLEVEMRFSLTLANANANMSGFVTREYFCDIVGSV